MSMRHCRQFILESSAGWVKPKFHLARHVPTRHDSTPSTCRAHAFWLCRACRHTRHDELDSLDSLDTLDTSSSTGSTRSTRRARQARLAT